MITRSWRPRRAEAGDWPSSGSPDCYIVVDPGTTRLRVGIVQVSHGQAAILGWSEGAWPDGTDPATLLAACERLLARALEMAEHGVDGPCAAEQILVGVPQSHLRAGSWSVNQRRLSQSEPIDEHELSGLLGRGLRLAVQGLLSRSLPTDREGSGRRPTRRLSGSAWVLVDATPVAITVDGRRVTDPVGFDGAQLGTTVFAAMADVATLESWRLIGKDLGLSALTLAPMPLVLTAGLPGAEGVALDIGGVTTDVILWRAGRPVTVDSLPLGGESVTAALVEKWHLAPERAEQVKRMYTSGRLEREAGAQLRDAMRPAVQLWLEETEAVLELMNRDEPLPGHVYLLGGGSALPEMAEATRALAWSERLVFSRYPQVRCLQPTDVPGLSNATGQTFAAGDLSLLALSAWAARRGCSQDRPELLLGRLCTRYQRGWC
jgi:cell division protein FtsA